MAEEAEDAPHHIKEMRKRIMYARLMLESSGLKLSILPHPKRCKNCNGWLRRTYIHINIGYRYYCPKCGSEFFIPLKKLIETYERRNKA